MRYYMRVTAEPLVIDPISKGIKGSESKSNTKVQSVLDLVLNIVIRVKITSLEARKRNF